MRNGTRSMMITTLIAAVVATVGVVGGGATNIGAAEQWESEIVGNPDGEPFRVVPDGEIVAVEVGSGLQVEYVGLITGDGTVTRTQEPTDLDWPVFRWDLQPGERIVEVFGDLDQAFGIASVGVRTSHDRRLSSFGASDIDGGAGADFQLFAPDGHGLVGLIGRSYGVDVFGFPTGHLAALGIVTEPMETDDACEFTVTNGSDRLVMASWALNFDLPPSDGIGELGELAPGATETFTMPAGFVPQAPYWSVFVLEYIDVDGPPEWTYWQAGLEPCGSVLVLDPDAIVFPPPPDTTAPSAPTGLAALVESFDDGVGGVEALVFLTWEEAADDVGAVEYDVLRNGVVFDTVSSLGTVDRRGAGASGWYQVVARDAAGNESVRTAPIRVDVPVPDTRRPTAPTNLRAVFDSTDVVISWGASSDDRGVDVYEVLRNGVRLGLTSETRFRINDVAFGSHWYQVRAIDSAGNMSAKTPPVQLAADPTPPAALRNLEALIDENGDWFLMWTPPTEDDWEFYEIYRNGELIELVGDYYLVPPLPPGSYWFQVTVGDVWGSTSAKTPPVRIDIATPDVEPPSAPRNLAAVAEANGDVTLSWDASSDNVAVTEYQVLRNGVEIAVVATPGFVVPAPAVGSHWYQVRARDAAGNEGNKTAPLRVDIV